MCVCAHVSPQAPYQTVTCYPSLQQPPPWAFLPPYWELIWRCFINESQRKCQLCIKYLSSSGKQRAVLCLWDKREEKCISFWTTQIQVCQECPAALCPVVAHRLWSVDEAFVSIACEWNCPCVDSAMQWGDHNGYSSRAHISDDPTFSVCKWEKNMGGVRHAKYAHLSERHATTHSCNRGQWRRK